MTPIKERLKTALEDARRISPLFNDLEQFGRILLIKAKRYLGRRYLSVNIDTNNRCNLACKYCHVHLARVDQKEPPIFLDINDYARIAQQLFPLTQRLFLSCATEPLLTRNFMDYVRVAKQYQVPTIGFVTNGLLFTDELIKQCVAEKIDLIQFSIDAALPETYAEIRGGDLAKLLVVLEGFRSIKASLGTTKPEIQVNYTIFDRNAAELPLFIKKYHHLFQQLNIGNLIKTDERVPYHRLPPKEFDLAVQNARKLGQDLGIMVTAVYYRKKNDGRRARCFQPYYYRNIDSRGDLRVCSGAVIGNLLHDDHAAIMSAKKEYLSDLAALSDQACLNCW